jgi:hypothetical protein
MATDPKINLNVSTSDAVKNLSTLEGAAIDSDTAIEKIDGSTVNVDTSATTRALQEVADKLDKVDQNANKAGKQGIPVSTNAFKDLTEGIGGPATGALGGAFAFGEGIEGLGDLLEGFGGKLGLTEGQIGKITTALGTALGVLGTVGVAFALVQAANEKWGDTAAKEAKKQEELNQKIDATAESLRDVARAFREGDKAAAFRGIVDDLTPLLDDMAAAGIDAADAVLDIATGSTRTEEKLKALGIETLKSAGGIENLTAKDVAYMKNNELLIEELSNRRIGMERATEQDLIAETALEQFNTTTEQTIELQREQVEAVLDTIDANRQFERSLDDTQQALDDYNQAIKDAKGDTEKIDDAARDAADTVIELATEFGGLEGAATGTEEWQTRTTNALAYVAGTLAPDDPLRKRLLDYKAELDTIPAVKTTAITATYPGGALQPGGQAVATPGQKLFGAPGSTNTTINVTVTSADPQAVVKALQTYVRQNGSLPANLR